MRHSGRERRAVAYWLTLVICLMAGLAGAIGGPYGVVLPRLLGGDPTPIDYAIVTSLRVPRILGGALVGAALAVAGVLSQTITRNPLSDPGLMGVSSGALLGGVLARLYWPGPETSPAWTCVLGALAATAAVLAIHQRLPPRSAPSLILVGMAVNAILGGVVAVVTASGADRFVALRLWLSGSLAGRTQAAFVASSALILPVLVAVWLLHRQLDVLQLGSDRAKSLGAHPSTTICVAVGAIAWLVGTATAFAGPISFIGLAAPHLAGALARSRRHGLLLPASAALGAALVVSADGIGRAWAGPGELPVAVVCAVLGAPFLIAMGLTGSRRGAGR